MPDASGQFHHSTGPVGRHTVALCMLIKLLGDSYDQIDGSEAGRSKAKSIINYLSPLADYAESRNYYYLTNPDNAGLNPRQVQVHGAVSILDLKKRTIESLYGFYGDEWVMITLDSFK